jgi:RNase H-like domain found in reverse transcriptase/Reverse transcriptase (RNA-dependent DNA polymerase)/Integrase zinc binding domain/Chromo (CHRromatin Organisation MOdifier) domain/Integrase core domain
VARTGFLNRAHAKAAVLASERACGSREGPKSIEDLNSYSGINSCVIPELKPSSSHFKVNVNLKGRNRSASVAAMVDCGATALFISKRFVKSNRIRTYLLPREIPLYNIDGSKNRAGGITHFVRLQLGVGNSDDWRELLVTDLGPEDVVLGLPWLRSANPKIDWAKGKMKIDPGGEQVEEVRAERIAANRQQRRRWSKTKVLEDPSDRLWCAAGYTYSTELAEKAGKSKPKRTFEEIVPKEYRQYAKVFSEAESERLPEHKPYDHSIDLKPETPETIRSKVYPMPVNEQGELDRFLEENLRKGYIIPSKSPIASPVFFIKKKDGRLRLVQDYRKLNEYTIKNRYPLPLASDIINRLQQARLFTKFDVRWGYNNIRIKAGDEWKAAFTTNRGLFEPQVMLFGLTNSPATFQALMNTIFVDLVAAGKVAVYLDDILIYSPTPEQHKEVTHDVLQRLHAHDLYLRPEKCEFDQTEVEYLGLIIRQGEVRMDPIKIQAITDWPPPRNLKELRGFLGFANFYRRFIKDFAKLTRPLNDLTKKDARWSWDDSQQQAFESLKFSFTQKPILTMWQPDRPTRIEVDASGYATGGVLLQQLEDHLWHPVAYRSQSMADAERNYEIQDKEMLAIIRALEDWRHYLEGLPQPFDILSDHHNLQYWRTAQDLSRRQARWSLYLSRFDFRLSHKPGSSNTQADPLSRFSSHQVSDADDNQRQIVLQPHHFISTAVSSFTDTDHLEQDIRCAVDRDPQVTLALQLLNQKPPQALTDHLSDWEERDGLVFFRGRVYVPKGLNLRQRITRLCHDTQSTGHPGQHATLELVSRLYWWPGMTTFVNKYVAGCDTCQRCKPVRHPRAILQPHDVPEGPWQTIGVDLITGLPRVDKYDAIVVYIDHYSKQVHIIPTTSDVDAEGIADIHYREIFRLHGIPAKIVSDRGPQFAARLMKALYQKLGITHALTTAYHPQANGQTERANQEVEQHLRLFSNSRQNDWVEHLPTAEFVLNNRFHSAHRMTPFEVMYGYRPDFTVPVGPPTKFPALDHRLQNLRETRNEAEAALRIEKRTMKQTFEAGKPPPHTFQSGDKVWLASKDIHTSHPSRKLMPRQLGPYEVLERTGDLTYRLRLPMGMRQHPVFHIDRLSPWKGNEINGRDPPPPEPVEVEDQLEYEVEDILDSRKYRNQYQYLVKWKGYDTGHNSWEPAAHLAHSAELVDAFHAAHPSAPRRLSSTIFATLPWQPRLTFTQPLPSPLTWESGIAAAGTSAVGRG